MLISLSIVLSYLIGSLPFAYLFFKIFRKQNITREGSGNVGAMNSYQVTGKKWIGILVFILDCLKGFFAIWLIKTISSSDFWSIFYASIFVILGHNYSIFLKFKGGRGLATAVGVSLATSPLILIVWAGLWIIGYYTIKRDIHTGNISATIMTAPVFFVLPDTFIGDTMFFYPPSIFLVRILVTSMCLVIFLKHLQPLKELMSKENNSEDD
jgi:glycerol-3-phosphate acyltransferase PlsY